MQARCDAELPPIISIVRHAGRPVILGMEFESLLRTFESRGPRTMHNSHKELPHRVIFFWGGGGGGCGVRIVGTLRNKQHPHHPQSCTRDVNRRFCGGGAWISRSESHSGRKSLLSRLFVSLSLGCFGFCRGTSGSQNM